MMVEPTAPPTSSPVPILPTRTLQPTPTFDLPANPEACMASIDRHVLREPNGGTDGDERYTLSDEEWSGYLDLMGIETLCIPSGFGAPYLNADWNGIADPSVAIGRMVSIGFERLNDGQFGWSRGYLLYSTYDFVGGTEYQDFAEPDDLSALRERTIANPIQVHGVDGFVRYLPGLPMGGQTIAKTYVFPFEDYYVAAILELGVFPPDQVEQLLVEIEAGNHPSTTIPYVALMDELVQSVLFH